MNIQPIVEGHGEVEAVPILLRRLRDEAQAYPLEVNSPIRGHSTDFYDEDRVRVLVRLAKKHELCDAILFVFDRDEENNCPKFNAPKILEWAKSEAGGIPCAIVIANREYEAWFLASIESLRGRRGIRMDAQSHPDPELPRDAKGQVEARMEARRSYHPTADQPALTAVVDLAPIYQKCRSFRHLVKVFGELVFSTGGTPQNWPPRNWCEPI